MPHELGTAFEALRPALERMARARPLHRELTPEALAAARAPGDLTVVAAAGDIEATIRPERSTKTASAWSGPGWNGACRGRGWLAAARDRLANRRSWPRRRRSSKAPSPAKPSWRSRSSGARRTGRLTGLTGPCQAGPATTSYVATTGQVVGRVARLGHDPAVDGAQAAAEHVVDPVQAARGTPWVASLDPDRAEGVVEALASDRSSGASTATLKSPVTTMGAPMPSAIRASSSACARRCSAPGVGEVGGHDREAPHLPDTRPPTAQRGSRVP